MKPAIKLRENKKKLPLNVRFYCNEWVGLNGMASENGKQNFRYMNKKTNNKKKHDTQPSVLNVNMSAQSVVNEEGNKMSILFNEVLDMMIYS